MGGEAPECEHLCDCEQEQQCRDGRCIDVDGGFLCCDNPGCFEGMRCEGRDGENSLCSALPGECLSNEECNFDQFCEKSSGDCDGLGSCQLQPQACDQVEQFVCGCNRETYENDCIRQSMGISLLHEGQCDMLMCQSPMDCLGRSWEILCRGHWRCEDNLCVEFCDDNLCGDENCEPFMGESINTCPQDCDQQCRLPADCAAEIWPLNCIGHWECVAGACIPNCSRCAGVGDLLPGLPGESCCPGLEARPASELDPETGICSVSDAMICLACGDGICNPMEGSCLCPEDCEGANTCVTEGGFCAPECPGGTEAARLSGCDPGGICCRPIEQPNICENEGGFCSPHCPDGSTRVRLPGCDPEACCMRTAPNICEREGGFCSAQCPEGSARAGMPGCEPEACCVRIVPNICEREGGFCSARCPEGSARVGMPGCDPEACCMQGAVQNVCLENGGRCLEGRCPPGSEPADMACNNGGGCCMRVERCLSAGETGPVIPEAPSCCPGLEQIGVSNLGVDGVCMERDGVFLCSGCGNNNCEPWENICNCIQDCPANRP